MGFRSVYFITVRLNVKPKRSVSNCVIKNQDYRVVLSISPISEMGRFDFRSYVPLLIHKSELAGRLELKVNVTVFRVSLN